MNTIQVKHVLPYFISGTESSVSEIWQQEVTFNKGDCYLVSATSGAGKSSLLSYLFGERTDFRGDIILGDKSIHALNNKKWNDIRKHNLSFVFQGLRLFSGLTVLENIAIKNKLTNHKNLRQINEMLDSSGIGDKKNEKTAHLSYGQQQRVAIIRALCQPFDFLLIDEPFSHLDENNIQIMSELISNELQSQQAGMILCSLGPQYQFNYQRLFKL